MDRQGSGALHRTIADDEALEHSGSQVRHIQDPLLAFEKPADHAPLPGVDFLGRDG